MDDVVFKLLLLLGREHVSEDQEKYARGLLVQLKDWNRFMSLAHAKMVSGFVYQNLERIGGVDSEILERWRQLYRGVALNALRVRAEMQAFQQTCIAPTAARSVFFKGPALAETYYASPSLRPSRDLDVLIPDEDFEAVFRAALEQGYWVAVTEETRPERPDEETCQALLKYSSVINFLSPRGVHVEMHRHLDKHTKLFPTEDLVTSAEDLVLAGTTYKVLPLDMLLCYVCFHNSRHVWSHLHWLSDLDAIVRNPDFDRGRAMEVARRKGLDQLVKACLEMHALVAAPWTWTEDQKQTPGGKLLSLCEMNLAGGLEVEEEIRTSLGWRSVPYKEFLSPKMQRRLRRRQAVHRLHPTIREYLEWPLPERWHFMYYFTRLIWRVRLHVLKTA